MQIAANGGVLEEAPENTMYAFELAVEQEAGILKVDVRGTKDGELVVMRDATIDRTTNGKGFVSGLFFDEVAVYDAGSWLGEEFEGETVPLLREVLRFAKINDLEVILDVKEQGIESDILAMVQSLGMMQKVYFWGILSNLREAEPSLVGPELVFLSPEELTPANINRAHSQNKDVITSLLKTDDRGKMREVMMKGPDIILVDFPAVASDILNQKGRRRAIRRIQKRRPLVTVPFSGRVADMDKMDEFIEKDEGGRKGVIDLLDPVGSLYHLLLGDGGERDMKDLEKSSRRASLRRELKSLNRELHEPGEGDKGFFDRAVGKVKMGMSVDEADDSRMAALEMTELPPFAVVPYLVEALDSKRPEVRANAVWALGLIGDYTVMPELIRLLEDDEDLNVRREAEISLGRLRQTEAVRFLRRRLVHDGAPPVRFDAARSIGEIGDPSAIGDLIRAMHGDVVSTAPNDVNVVKLREGDVDWRVRGVCAQALGKIGDPSAAAKLGEVLMENANEQYSMWARSQAAWALSSIGEDSLGVLLTALRDDERFVRRESAWALIRIGQPAIPALLRALRDPDARVRERAALALGWIGDSKAIQSLVRSLYDENIKVREAVVWAIGHIGGSRAQDVLKSLVNDNEDERIKEMAGEAIARQSRRGK
ncbi:MAG: HEAT repeat domain-containing protein [Planctomycetota bacterium]